jgi:hypothetical protein
MEDALTIAALWIGGMILAAGLLAFALGYYFLWRSSRGKWGS